MAQVYKKVIFRNEIGILTSLGPVVQKKKGQNVLPLTQNASMCVCTIGGHVVEQADRWVDCVIPGHLSGMCAFLRLDLYTRWETRPSLGRGVGLNSRHALYFLLA